MKIKYNKINNVKVAYLPNYMMLFNNTAQFFLIF